MTRKQAIKGARVRSLIGDTTRIGTVLRCHTVYAQVWVKWESGRDSWIDLKSLVAL